MVTRNPISRGNLTHQQWQQLQALLPKPSVQGGRPAKDHRTVIDGILWILRTGAPIALRAFKKGATCQTVMEPGKPFLVAFTLGGRVVVGNQSWSDDNNGPMRRANLTESSISSMAA